MAVVQNSALLNSVNAAHLCYEKICNACVQAATILGVKAPIRIDCRADSDNETFYLFDINMKPNMTGPGRPGRDDQDSLSSIAGRSPDVGWDFKFLLLNILNQA